jgi:hypothetical protein
MGSGDRSNMPRLGEIENQAIGFNGRKNILDLANSKIEVRRYLAQPAPDRLLSVGSMVLASFDADHPTFGPDESEEGKSQSAGSGAGFEDRHPWCDVCVDRNRPDVLGVNDGGAPRHLQDEISKPRTESKKTPTERRLDLGPWSKTDQIIVLDDSQMVVKLVAWLEAYEITATFAIDQKDVLVSNELHRRESSRITFIA